MKTAIVAMVMLVGCCAYAGGLESDVKARVEGWAKAFNAHDPDALLGYYADDPRFIFAFEGQEGQGKDALKAFFAQSFQATPDVQVKLVSYEVVKLSETSAVGYGIWEDSLTTPDGKKAKIPAQSSEIFTKVGGVWRVKVDHASFVPPPPPK